MRVLGVTNAAVEFLREKIITGEFPANKRLSENEIADELQISRAPLREAFRTLEKDSLIVEKPRRGRYVAGVSLKDFIELYQAREMIEIYSLDLLKEMRLKKLPEVEQAFEERENLKIPDSNGSSREKLDYLYGLVGFHTALVKSTGNKQLISFFKKINFHMARYQFIHAFIPNVSRRSEGDHEQIYRYIKNGQWQKAKKLLMSHIRSFFNDMRTNLI